MSGKRPNSCTNLNKALLRLAGNDEAFLDLRATMANIIVAQLLPDGVVKGSSQHVELGIGWDALYKAQRGALPVLPTVDEAIDWANDLIAQIATAE